ncbi:MAG: response regulator [Pseudomonadota bacterium]
MVSTVLVIDDSKSSRGLNLAYMRDLMEPQTRFLEAAGGAQALAILAEQPVELVLLDLTMPGMSGYEVLAELQRLNAGAQIIVISADIQSQTRARVSALGAAAFIEKPIKFDTLRAVLLELGATHEH